MHRVPGWRQWFVRPRAQLSWRTNYRHYLFVAMGDLSLLFFGVVFAFSPQQPSDRVWGIAMVGGSVVLSAFLAAYLRRPISGKSHRGF